MKFTLKTQKEIDVLLREDYSLEQITGVFVKQGKVVVSIVRIYQHIWDDKKVSGIVYTHLRRQVSTYRKHV
jgi:IS30 family transposase